MLSHVLCVENARDRDDAIKKPGDEPVHELRANSPESLPPIYDQPLVPIYILTCGAYVEM